MSGAASGSGKKRKKQAGPDNNQAQKNTKCANEKRRREKENEYIEELADLISASFTDMSSLSVKPDKCAILQETVAQIRNIKDQEARAASDAVQQGEVSSSRPTIPNEVFGPLLLEALEGFLFVVNPEGKIEFCTENISQFIKYRREEVVGQSVYNFIHHGDHTRFSAWLLPSFPPAVGWGSGSEGSPASASAIARRLTFNCRFLVKPPHDSTVEEKQQRPSKYENMQISSTLLPQNNTVEKDEDGSESGPCLMCVARRIPPSEKSVGNPLEQFTMKLNTSGRIIGLDSTGVSAPYSQYLTKDLIHRNLEDLVLSGDISKVNSHLKEALTNGQSTTSVYKLQIGLEKTISVQTKLKFFKSNNRTESDFIMATHSLVNENETHLEQGSPGGAGGTSSQPGNNNNNSQQSQGPHGPCTPNSGSMSNSVNGGNRDLSNTITLNNSSAFHSVTLNSADLTDFSFDISFPSSTWELGGEERVWERPESRQSLTPVQSPLYTAGQPQPSPAAQNSFSSGTPYGFSPLGGPPSQEESGHQEEDSQRLRDLLMNNRPSTESDEGGGGGAPPGGGQTAAQRKKHPILQMILNQPEDEESHKQETKPNNMLLNLLNTKSDDDGVEAKAGLRSQNELLQQLLKPEEGAQETKQQMRSCGFGGENQGGGGGGGGGGSGGAEESRGGRKRPSSEESDDQPGAKRPLDSLIDSIPPPTSTGNTTTTAGPSSGKSKLWEQNKMLASLLAQRPTTPASIPPIPASILSATPQDKFPRLVNKHPQAGWSGGSMQTSGGSPGQNRSNRSPGYSGNTWDSDDPALSTILDQVIELVPDGPDVTTVDSTPALMSVLNTMEAEAQQSALQQQQQFHQEFINEKMAINAIQESLMLCESAVKGSSYPPPMSQGSPQAQQQFPPPPIYQPRQKFPIQQQQQQQIRQQFNRQQLYIAQAQRTKLQQQQQMQKQRLLHLQQQQQIVVPQAAASTPDPALHNIDSLMNNTVAPNVSLQRSASVPDSQLSPVGSYPGLSSVPSPGQRRPYSPVNGGMTSFPSGGGGGTPVSGAGAPQARLSPSLQGYQPQPQLSPRLTPQSQQNYGGGTSWPQQNSRLTLQQDNPVLNAQLSSQGRGYPGRGGSGLPPVRSLGGPQQRFSSPVEQAPSPSYQFRIQRQVSAPPQPVQQPSPTPQLPGGGRVGYGGLSSPPLCHHPGPGVYPDQQYCYQQQDPAYPPRLLHQSHGGNNGVTEYVRQELRSLVGARTGGSSRPQVPGALPLPSPTHVDLDTLTFDMPPVSDSSKMWGSMSDMGTGSPQSNQQLTPRSTMEEVSRSNDQKSSLLQKLLSE